MSEKEEKTESELKEEKYNSQNEDSEKEQLDEIEEDKDEEESDYGDQFRQEIVELLRSGLEKEDLLYKLSDYHENDIADALTVLTEEERKKIYPILGVEIVADIMPYMDDASDYLEEIGNTKAAEVLSEMDTADAVDILTDMDEDARNEMVSLLDEEAGKDVQMILSYDDDEIGSAMNTNFIVIENDLTIKQATHSMIEQAGENDNISTIFTTDSEGKFYGAIDLKDLIIARGKDNLEDLISTSFPYVYAHDKRSDCIERLKDYAEDSIPVLDEDNKILGVITAQDIVQVVDDEMSEDYAKLAGLTAEEDMEESTLTSMRKRLPWLIILLFMGMGVSFVVGTFEAVVAAIPIVLCFQSLILGMAGNVGTQSLAVTIRVLMDEKLSAKDKLKLVFKELRVGFSNGLFLGITAFIVVGLYILVLKGEPAEFSFLVSGCVGFALLMAMSISSLTGTLIPLFFHKIKVDPAVASGPLISTVNDLVAVLTYYGFSWILLINVFHLG